MIKAPLKYHVFLISALVLSLLISCHHRPGSNLCFNVLCVPLCNRELVENPVVLKKDKKGIQRQTQEQFSVCVSFLV